MRGSVNISNLPAIKPMGREHWPEVLRIYREGIATGNATFEVEAPSWEKWDGSHLPNCRLIAQEESKILGWAALSPVSSRRVHAGVVADSAYVAEAARGKGIGKSLLSALIESSADCGVWTLEAGIFPESTASITLQKSLGFREVGRRERFGKMGDACRAALRAGR